MNRKFFDKIEKDILPLQVDVKGKYKQFEKDLTFLINRHSMEMFSNTPDYILAEYLTGCLIAFTKAVITDQEWKRKSY